jgi:hypothetical protein
MINPAKTLFLFSSFLHKGIMTLQTPGAIKIKIGSTGLEI